MKKKEQLQKRGNLAECCVSEFLEDVPDDIATRTFNVINQQCAPAESLRTPGVDRRIRITPTLGFASGSVGQLVMKFDDGNHYIGTASIIRFSDTSDFLLTCAHNFVITVPGIDGDIPRKAVSGTFFKGRHDTTTYRGKFKILRWVVHPKYPQNEIYGWRSGYDIAIAEFDRSAYKDDKVITQNSSWAIDADKRVKKGATIKIWGYPGEKDGSQYGMQGNVMDLKTTDKGGKIITYDNLDTTPGQSGSPVALYDPNADLHIIVGVHVAGTVEANVGTFMTTEISKWIISMSKRYFK